MSIKRRSSPVLRRRVHCQNGNETDYYFDDTLRALKNRDCSTLVRKKLHQCNGVKASRA